MCNSKQANGNKRTLQIIHLNLAISNSVISNPRCLELKPIPLALVFQSYLISAISNSPRYLFSRESSR